MVEKNQMMPETKQTMMTPIARLHAEFRMLSVPTTMLNTPTAVRIPGRFGPATA
jgi:hypothetical protein